MEKKADNKSVLIISNFCDYGNDQFNDRFNYIAHLLAQEGIQTELLTSSFSHRNKKQREKAVTSRQYQCNLLFEPGYKRNISLRRFWSHYVWGKNVAKYLRTIREPDVIYCAVPSLTAAREAAKYCNKRGIRFAVDVQDLWPEAFKMVLNIPLISQVLFFPFQKYADSIYRKADEIFAVSETYAERVRAVNQKQAKEYVAYIGTDLREFDRGAKMPQSLLKKSDDELWLTYCGTLANSYDMKCAIDAVNIANQDSRQPIKLVVMGDGPLMNEFEQYAKQVSADAVFLGRVPYEIMCAILAQSDFTINPIVKGSAASIINKHADYAASGLPVINTQDSKEYIALVEQYQMGFNCAPGDSAAVAQKLVELASDEQQRVRMGKNARRCAQERFDRAHTYQKIKEVLAL